MGRWPRGLPTGACIALRSIAPILDDRCPACSALRVEAVRQLLGSLLFVERRARRGAPQIEKLLRDYSLAHQQLTTLNISALKQAMTKAEFNNFSRAALLSFLGEFAVFLASNRTLITHYPGLTLQARYVSDVVVTLLQRCH